MSLTEAALQIFLFRLGGCVLWGLIVGAVIAGIRKYAASMLAALALMLIPYYGLPQEYMKYFLPGPLGFFIGTGYCRGTVFEYNELTGREAFRFIQVPGHTKMFLAAGNFLIGVLMIEFILRAYTNHWRKKAKGHGGGKFVCMVFCMACLGGCSGRTVLPGTTGILYNLDNRYYYESEDFLVYMNYDGEGGSYIAVREKEGGNCFPLVRDVFSRNKEIYSCFYGEGNNVYYMERSFDNKDRYFSKLYDTVSIVCVNLDTFESRTIFRDNANISRNSLPGLGHDASFYSDIVAFVVREGNIYFISSAEVSEVNMVSGSRKTLFPFHSGNVAYDGDSFFFLDHMSRLCRYFLEEHRQEAVCGIAAGTFLLDRDRIIYTDREQNAALTALSFRAEEMEEGLSIGGALSMEGESSVEEGLALKEGFYKEVLLGEEPLAFYSDGEHIFFIPKRESVIYELEAGESGPKEIGPNKSVVIYPFSAYGALLIPDMQEGGVVEYLK